MFMLALWEVRLTKLFKNRENENIRLSDGRDIWLSRACAVVAEIFLFNISNHKWYVLLGKRGKGTPDCQGDWGLPCGYLDWDETLCEAMLREVWEECGIYLPSIGKESQFGYSTNSCILDEPGSIEEQPWAISDKPNTKKQNISFHFAVLFSWQAEPFPRLSNKNAEPDEVDELAWMPIEQALSFNLAFSHNRRISQFKEQHKNRFKDIEKHSTSNF